MPRPVTLYGRLLDDQDLIIRIMCQVLGLTNQEMINLLPDTRERMDILSGFGEMARAILDWLETLGLKY